MLQYLFRISLISCLMISHLHTAQGSPFLELYYICTIAPKLDELAIEATVLELHTQIQELIQQPSPVDYERRHYKLSSTLSTSLEEYQLALTERQDRLKALQKRLWSRQAVIQRYGCEFAHLHKTVETLKQDYWDLELWFLNKEIYSLVEYAPTVTNKFNQIEQYFQKLHGQLTTYSGTRHNELSETLENLQAEFKKEYFAITDTLDQSYYAAQVNAVAEKEAEAHHKTAMIEQGKGFCCVCADDNTQGFVLPCGDYFCSNCIESWMQAKIDDGCGRLPCLQFDYEEHHQYVPLDFFTPLGNDAVLVSLATSMSTLALRHTIQALDGIYPCTTANCRGWLDRKAAHDGLLRCERCYKKVCIECRQRGHGSSLCPKTDLDDEQKVQLGIKACPKCRQGVERREVGAEETDGHCYHMTCRCGHMWYWKTGESLHRDQNGQLRFDDGVLWDGSLSDGKGYGGRARPENMNLLARYQDGF